MKKLIAGNWKMNGNRAEAIDLAQGLVTSVKNDPAILEKADILICPPFLHIDAVKNVIEGSTIYLGVQDCSKNESGAFTGDISAYMIKDCGSSYVILGHSERRQHHFELDDVVSQKARIAHQHNMVAIICVGENEMERLEEDQENIVKSQLAQSIPETATAENTVIAYEPVWAIGTGKTASPQDVAEMHKFIRTQLQERFADGNKMRILYGGSMKPDNAEALLSTPNVDGGLIGGASLKADDFIAIAQKA